MKHLKLFEEFNPYTGMSFAEKLCIYAEASEVATKVTPILKAKNSLSFKIMTSIPGDYNGGHKSFEVVIPTDIVNKAYVITYENDKKVLTTSLEPQNENDINDILMNYIEATQIYDDSSVENIVDAYNQIKSPDDIKNIISQLG